MTRLFLLFLILISTEIKAQNQAIGQWREHLPYNRGKMVADAGDKIFCATEDALFAFVKEDGAIERYSRLTGMHDFGISAIAYDPASDVLVAGYSNSNIDLVYNSSIYNLPFIKEKNITGSKRINNIYIRNSNAYLACGFGIVVIDNSRQEIKDTYFIGANGSQMNVLDIASDGNSLFAATDSGVYAGSLNSNLADYNNWTRVLDDVNNSGDYNKIFFFGGKIYVNYAKPDAAATTSDELYVLENGTWNLFSIPEIPSQPRRNSFRISGNHLVFVNDQSISVFNDQMQRIQYYDQSLYSNAWMRDGLTDNENNTWIADGYKGLVKVSNGAPSIITPSGPASAYAASLEISDNKLWIAHGPMSVSWNPQDYPIEGFSSYENGTWMTYNRFTNPELATNGFSSNMSLSLVPGEKDHLRTGSVTYGVLDFNAGNINAFYDENNSTLLPATGNTTVTIVHGIMHDEEGNLWVVNSGVDRIFHVLKKDGSWKSFNMLGVINGAPFAGYIAIDQNNFKWINLYGGSGTTTTGLAVLDDNGTIDDESDDRKRFIGTEVYTRCIAVDNDGQLWVGTDEGPQVIYSPSAVFDDANINLQKILIFQDNTYQNLLETETVTYIAVDGANRKWIGTQASGVYLFSPDGQQEINHFTTDNSPLFSNYITCISINKESGEVFIGTDKGLISYQGDAIEGKDQCGTITVYPNPVQPSYNGPIAVKGVINNSTIKITDISGALVYEGTALGGQAIWNGRNLKGDKASTGVYLVFASDENGEQGCVTKLMFYK